MVTEPKEMIEYEDFAKLDLRLARVKSAERVPGAKKLLKLKVDLGPLGERQIIAGLAEHYEPEHFVGKYIVVVANLRPRRLRGELSEGMLLAAGCDPGDTPVLLVAEDEEKAKPGMRVC